MSAVSVAYYQIKAQCGKRLVVADDGVGAVFIRFVKFVPRGKTRFRQGLPQTAAGLLYARNALCQQV